MQKWEYKRITTVLCKAETWVRSVDDSKLGNKQPLLDEYLNESGSQGWEMENSDGTRLYFKGPIE
jgi:hypothetical protein